MSQSTSVADRPPVSSFGYRDDMSDFAGVAHWLRLKSHSKVSYGKWSTNSMADPGAALCAWSRGGDFNVGIIPHSGLVGIDIDTHALADEILSRVPADCRKNLRIHKTGRGLHLFGMCDPSLSIRLREGITKVDLRWGANGYLVYPGSVYGETRYEVVSRGDLRKAVISPDTFGHLLSFEKSENDPHRGVGERGELVTSSHRYEVSNGPVTTPPERLSELRLSISYLNDRQYDTRSESYCAAVSVAQSSGFTAKEVQDAVELKLHPKLVRTGKRLKDLKKDVVRIFDKNRSYHNGRTFIPGVVDKNRGLPKRVYTRETLRRAHAYTASKLGKFQRKVFYTIIDMAYAYAPISQAANEDSPVLTVNAGIADLAERLGRTKQQVSRAIKRIMDFELLGMAADYVFYYHGCRGNKVRKYYIPTHSLSKTAIESEALFLLSQVERNTDEFSLKDALRIVDTLDRCGIEVGNALESIYDIMPRADDTPGIH